MTSQTLDYRSALDLLYGRLDYERNAAVARRCQGLHLDRMRRLLAGLSNPHAALRVIHLAGTKGKGSSASMIRSMLTAAGYRTGLYTSPHLECLEERMEVDGQRCRPEQLVELVQEARPLIDQLDRQAKRLPGNRGPTFFEITTALAMRHFVRQAVDFAVLEVGMGGRLDSTNVCQPLVSVITSISFDHTRQLGSTLAAIAREKAGIIKPGVPVVSGVTQEEPGQVIRSVASQLGCPLLESGRDFSFVYRAPPAEDQLGEVNFQIELDGAPRRWDNLRLGLLGRHQAANAAVALATIVRLQEMGWTISEPAVRSGLTSARCPARVEVMARSPTVILDTAHNLASVEALLEVLQERFTARRRILVFAATRDKDLRGMLERLLPRFDRVILTRYLNNPRAAPLAEIQRLAGEISARLGLDPSGSAVACETPDQAWRLARETADPQDLICITGSFFLAAELRPLLVGLRGAGPLREAASAEVAEAAGL